MSNSIPPYPYLNDTLAGKIRFGKKPWAFFWTDTLKEEHALDFEPAEAQSSVNILKSDGIWTQDTCNLCLRRPCSLQTFQCLFGPEGVACRNAKLGLSIVWTSSDSKQRGVIPIGTFEQTDTVFSASAEKAFGKAQLRGEVCFTTVLYLADAGKPDPDELHLADKAGDILGELDSFILRLDGNGSSFPIYELEELGQPLWRVSCDWDDPSVDSFTDSVSINLNTAHKYYRYINQKDPGFDPQLLSEVMAAALSIIVEKARMSPEWDQILKGENLEEGSVGQALYYFSDTHGWDLSTTDTVSRSARKFFDDRMNSR